ncbi:hypothetical protein NDU88_004473 [Pleurodeles waltl]|uniref:O-methyltransferase dimerisation domain-containing protein n=1 Tax=Pleurodeles waltl TaxID=8319 RepID=A0AAV7NMC1_PLEWA|nr:hypothetical protein NDU88_004473 [Pleurodeles waltl]
MSTMATDQIDGDTARYKQGISAYYELLIDWRDQGILEDDEYAFLGKDYPGLPAFYVLPKAMFAACELGVFDLLHDSGTPLSSVTIAEHLHASADGIERLLCACVGLKLLEIEKNNSEEFYKNTDLSAIYLTKSSPKSLHTMMMYFSDTVYKYSEYLADAVSLFPTTRSSTHRKQSIYMTDSLEFWDRS